MTKRIGLKTQARLGATLLSWLMLYCLASNVLVSSKETVNGKNKSSKAVERNGLETKTTTEAARDVDFGPYMARLQKRIKKNWFPPKGKSSNRVSVVFKVDKEGKLSDLRITQSNSEKSGELAAMKAVQRAAPFDLLPDGSPQSVDIQFTFDYNVHGGNRSPSDAAGPGHDLAKSDHVAPAGNNAEQSAQQSAQQSIDRKATRQSSEPESRSDSSDLKQTQSLISQWTPFVFAGAVAALLLFLARERSKGETSVNLKSGKPNDDFKS